MRSGLTDALTGIADEVAIFREFWKCVKVASPGEGVCKNTGKDNVSLTRLLFSSSAE